MNRIPDLLKATPFGLLPWALGAIGVGAVVAMTLPQPAEALEPFIWPLVALLLFSTFTQINWRDIQPAADGRRFLLALALGQAIVVPVLVALLMLPLPADSPSLRIAILLVLLAPCTDWVVTFTNLGGGSTQQATLATPVLLAGQLLLLPLWLLILAGPQAVDAISPDRFLVVFAGVVLVPLGMAIMLELLTRRFRYVEKVDHASAASMSPLLLAVLFVLTASHLPQLQNAGGILVGVALIYVTYLAIIPALGRLIGWLAGLGAIATRTLIFSLGARNSFVVLPFALALPEPALAGAVVVMQSLIEVVGLLIYTRLVPRMLPDQA